MRLQGLAPDESFTDWSDRRGEAELLHRITAAWSMDERIDLLEVAVDGLRREIRQLLARESATYPKAIAELPDAR